MLNLGSFKFTILSQHSFVDSHILNSYRDQIRNLMEYLLIYRTRYMLRINVLVFIFVMLSNLSSAQDFPVKDTLTQESAFQETEKKHSPKMASALSAIIPGLGQIYNKKYWKVPVIYAGVGALFYVIGVNSERYDIFKSAYSLRIDGDTNTVDEYDISVDNGLPKYTDESLLNLKDFYRRNRDVSYIFMGVLYMLNVIDAAVDAHFFNYKITDDLSLKIRPALIFSQNHGQTTGIGLTLTL